MTLSWQGSVGHFTEMQTKFHSHNNLTRQAFPAISTENGQKIEKWKLWDVLSQDVSHTQSPSSHTLPAAPSCPRVARHIFSKVARNCLGRALMETSL